MIFETSKDLLFVVIAFCILWVTIFVCWILYYMIMTAKRVNDTVKATKDKIDKIGELIELLKTKINEGASYVGAMVEGVIKLSEYFKGREDDKKTTPRQARGRENHENKKSRKILVKKEK
ncbi:hypothetical protein HQ544_00145 [Candidatus Falkowbacteria bacterium]|nr:hypothetical protein [Candidatus Falkowbacteria bacterium]